jgi:7-cyano-7-deazaguanine synthase
MAGASPSGGGASSAAVVLLSGGMDSAVTLAEAKAAGLACHALSFDYGQRHRVELRSAALVAQHLGCASHKVLNLDLRAIGGSALTGAIDVPKERTQPRADESQIPVTYVPARNLTFLSLAVAHAEVLGAARVYLGVNAVDYSGYPDCRPEFIASFERTANLATRAGVEDATPHFRVVAPLIAMTKAQIIRRGVALGVDFAMTTSCYDPATDANGMPLACGACDSCLIRARGFAEAEVKDPTRYVAGHAGARP